jgi:hypothetical protein
MSLGGPNTSKFVVSAAEKPISGARISALVITAQLAENHVSIHLGKAEAAACG